MIDGQAMASHGEDTGKTSTVVQAATHRDRDRQGIDQTGENWLIKYPY